MWYDGDGRKTLKNTKTNTKTKEEFPVWLPSHHSVYEMEADCFPVSENKPDLP